MKRALWLWILITGVVGPRCLAASSQAAFRRYGIELTGAPGAFASGNGGIWFTEPVANRVGVLGYDGRIREFPVPTPKAGLVGIAISFTANGAFVWFTESSANQIGRIAPDGTITEFPVPTPGSEPWGIANDIFTEQVWFTERAGNAVARIDVDGTITERKIPTPNVSPTSITFIGVAGGDDIWVASSARNSVGRLPFPRYDSFVEIALPRPDSEPFALASAADGTLWFTERAGGRIGRVGQDFSLSEFSLVTGSRPSAIAADLERGEFLWFTEPGANRIGTITLDGGVTEYPLPAGVSGPSGIFTDGYQAFFGALSPPSVVRGEPDLEILLGAGRSGPWESRLELATDEPALRTVFMGAYHFPPFVCPGSCFGYTTADLPASGTISVSGPDINGGGLSVVFERPLGTGHLPAAHFRFANTARAIQAADAPVSLLSTISASDPALLAFPSASSSPSSKSNLFLANVGQDGSLAAHVEAFAPDGTPLGATDLTLETYAQNVLTDVLGRFGAASVDNAQVRVTKTFGDGLLWGMLATVVDEDGTLSISSGSNFAAADDVVLVGGAGVAGSWDTILDLANPDDRVGVGDILGRGPLPATVCPPDCPSPEYTIHANGTARLYASALLAPWDGHLIATTGPGIVHARVVNRANPVQAADLPTIAVSQLQAANPDVLVFPSARRGADVRTNLFLAGIGDGDPVRARVEVVSADGAVFATSEIDVTSWNEPGSTFYVDLLAQMGIDALSLGQIRVTRIGGAQLLWGVLSNVYADGRLSVVAPALP